MNPCRSPSYFEVKACKIWDFIGKNADSIDRTGWHFLFSEEPIFDCDALIFNAKCRCLMDNTRAICVSDVCVNNDPEGSIFELGWFQRGAATSLR